jgi:hypothetical protein
VAKPKSINPCKMKGRYLGHRGGGRRYTAPALHKPLRPKACECASSFLNVCSTTKNYMTPKANYFLNKKSEMLSSDFVRRKPLDPHPKNTLVSVPCEKAFLHPESEGTKAYRALKHRQDVQTKFKGCYSVDEELLDQKLINYDLREGTGKYFDVAGALDVQDYASEIQDLNFFEVLTKLSNVNSAARLLNLGYLNHALDRLDQNLIHNAENPLKEESYTPFDEDGIDEANLKKLRKLSKAFKKMTRIQRLTVRAVYLKNFQAKTKVEIADALGISIDSLKERLSGAFAKIKAEFVDLFPVKKVQTTAIEVRLPPLERIPKIPQPIRIIKPHCEVLILIPTEQDPRPLGEKKMRTDIDVDLVKRKLRAA